ncbi:MAG: BREX-3 system P-loop-containing protein BrxF [Lentisphaeria bacterium]
MVESIENKVIQSLKAAEELYHRLVLIVGKSGSGKTSVIQNLAKRHHTEPININLRLSKELLELTEKQRQLKLAEILAQAVNGNGDKVFLDNTEILFDIDLKQDPLRLLQGLSRNFSIVASWNGTLKKGKLTYAEPGHREYRSYDLSDTLVVSMNGEATVDFKQARIN